MNRTLLYIISLMLASSAVFTACAPPETPEPATPTPTPELSEFERELRSLKIADFDYIYVLRRKDGAPFSAADKEYIRQNRHHATNRSSLSEDEKVIFVGSNFAFDEAGLENLKARFVFEDFSKPAALIKKEEEEANKNAAGDSGSNSNANK